MKIFLIIATLFGFLVSSHAQTTVRVTLSNSEIWDVVYRDSVTFSAYETTIDDAPWWNNNDDISGAGWATALYNANNSLTGIRFAYDTLAIAGNDYALYYDQTNGSNSHANLDAQSASYAVRATQVPAPFPILGSLPVGGFLKRMRRRHKAS